MRELSPETLSRLWHLAHPGEHGHINGKEGSLRLWIDTAKMFEENIGKAIKKCIQECAVVREELVINSELRIDDTERVPSSEASG